jgi:tagatose 1,6-diphosphate aldolase
MASALSVESLPAPSGVLSAGAVSLRLAQILPGEPARALVPSYHFRILISGGTDVGHLNFRVGETDHVRLVAGHIGYEVLEQHRGHGYAREACLAVAPFVRQLYEAVTITCDPENLPSRRTIEHLGATFLEEVHVPPHDPHYRHGSRRKRLYRWIP